jgi:hypothetical protein
MCKLRRARAGPARVVAAGETQPTNRETHGVVPGAGCDVSSSGRPVCFCQRPGRLTQMRPPTKAVSASLFNRLFAVSFSLAGRRAPAL